MVEITTHVVVEGVRRNVQTQVEQIRGDSQRRDKESKRQVEKIAANLATLTEQLNRFKPTSTVEVTGNQQSMSEAVENRLHLQSLRLDAVNESVQ